MSDVKYKKSGNSEFIKVTIDENGKENRSATFGPNNKPKTMGAGFYKEMQEWLKIQGNTIEPQYTSEELTQKEDDELQSALKGQKSQCIQILRDTLHTQSDDFDYPNDKGTWKEYRDLVKIVMRSDQLETIPDKPTF